MRSFAAFGVRWDRQLPASAVTKVAALVTARGFTKLGCGRHGILRCQKGAPEVERNTLNFPDVGECRRAGTHG